MEQLHLGYAVAGGLAVALVLGAHWVRPRPVTEPMVALLAGMALGAAGVVAIPREVEAVVLLEGSRLALAVSLVGVGLRFGARDLRAVVRPVAVLVVVGMGLSALATAGLAVGLLGFTWPIALVLGACLCPTDPVLASDVVAGDAAADALPDRVRQVLTVESGANDGLALPLVVLALALTPAGHTGGLGAAALQGVREVAVALPAGVVVGWVVGRTVRALDRRGEVEQPSALLLSLLMGVATLGVVRSLGGDGVLGVFVAALAFDAAVGERERERQEELDEAVNRFLVVPVFLLVGATIPWEAWAALGWGGAGFAVAVLVLRRLPVVVALRRPAGLARRDAVFLGWFGPMGVSAVLYLAHTAHQGLEDPRVLAAGVLAVAASTLVHGATAVPGRRVYRRLADGAARSAAGT